VFLGFQILRCFLKILGREHSPLLSGYPASTVVIVFSETCYNICMVDSCKCTGLVYLYWCECVLVFCGHIYYTGAIYLDRCDECL